MRKAIKPRMAMNMKAYAIRRSFENMRDFNLLIRKRSFSQTNVRHMDPRDWSLDRLNKLGKDLVRKQKEQLDSQKILVEDKMDANKFRVSSAKLENQQSIPTADLVDMTRFRNNYPTFFEEDEEGSSPDPYISEGGKDRERAAQVIEYLKEEIKAGHNQIEETSKEIKNIFDLIRLKANTVNSEMDSSRFAPYQASGSSQASGPSQGTVPFVPSQIATLSQMPVPSQAPIQSATSESSTKALVPGNESATQTLPHANKSTIDFVDSLPKDYNPMDDLGDD